MCDICDSDLSHLEGCPLDHGGDEQVCSVCGSTISNGDRYIYHIGGIESGLVCEQCIEQFSISELLDICGIETVLDAIAELSGKVMRAGDKY